MFERDLFPMSTLVKIRYSNMLTMSHPFYSEFYNSLVENNSEKTWGKTDKGKDKKFWVSLKTQHLIPAFILVSFKGNKIQLKDLQGNIREYKVNKKEFTKEATKNKIKIGDYVLFDVDYSELRNEEEEDFTVYRYAEQMKGKLVSIKKGVYDNLIIKNGQIEVFTMWRHDQDLPRLSPCTWMDQPDSVTKMKLLDIDMRNAIFYYHEALGDLYLEAYNVKDTAKMEKIIMKIPELKQVYIITELIKVANLENRLVPKLLVTQLYELLPKIGKRIYDRLIAEGTVVDFVTFTGGGFSAYAKWTKNQTDKLIKLNLIGWENGRERAQRLIGSYKINALLQCTVPIYPKIDYDYLKRSNPSFYILRNGMIRTNFGNDMELYKYINEYSKLCVPYSSKANDLVSYRSKKELNEISAKEYWGFLCQARKRLWLPYKDLIDLVS